MPEVTPFHQLPRRGIMRKVVKLVSVLALFAGSALEEPPSPPLR